MANVNSHHRSACHGRTLPHIRTENGHAVRIAQQSERQIGAEMRLEKVTALIAVLAVVQEMVPGGVKYNALVALMGVGGDCIIEPRFPSCSDYLCGGVLF